MGKLGKLKSGTKSKTKRWKKGQSSSSNPELAVHREKARAKFFHVQPTSKSNKGLTLEAMKIHDEIHDSQPSYPMKDGSEGAHTFGTFLSGLSDCSNITFHKIQRYWQNNSSKHKEVCAVIAAITEVIRQQGGMESDTAYFAALVTALDSVETVESMAAVAYLLSMTCKRVPVAVLRAKFSEVSKLLVDRLAHFANKSDVLPTALIRSLLLCLSTLLRNQGLETWTTSSTMNVYQTLLSFSFNSKPKIRKAAQNGICAVLKASSFMSDQAAKQVHPAAAATAKYCIQFIEKSGAVKAENASSTCHAVSLMGDILHCFPSTSLKSSCETILKLMTLSQPVVKTVCLQAFYSMFKNQPDTENLPAELNAQLMTALYDYLPSSNDTQLLQAWLTVMEEALKNMSRMQSPTECESKVERLILAHSMKLCRTCMKIMESGVFSSAQAAAATISTVIEKGMCDMQRNGDDADGTESSAQTSTVKELFKILEEGLKYKYHSVWDSVFKVLHSAFTQFACPVNFPSMRASVLSMSDLRNTPLFSHKVSLDKALGAAVEGIGPKLFLEAVPLLIDGTETDYDFPRGWILPLMRGYVKNTELSFFTSYFLPLAAKLQQRATKLRNSDEEATASTYETLQYQIWLLLPNFCDGAKDIKTAFPTLARTLGSAITERDELRPIAMQALRVLISKCGSEDDRQTISRFAKNYLPILFNLYTTLPTKTDDAATMETEDLDETDLNKKKSPDRLAALETIRLYLPLADPKLISNYFATAEKRVFDGSNESDATRLALLDLLVSMAMFLDRDNLLQVYENMKPMLNSPNHSMQKKAYRLLEEVCGSDSIECRAFVQTKLPEIKSLLTDGLTAASPSAKGPRLKCMERVLKLLATEEKYSAEECITFMRELIPEVIMCTREKKRARVSAFSLLITAGDVYLDIASRSTGEGQDVREMKRKALSEYFQISFAGLGGSPITITASICALSRLVYQYKDIMPSDLLNDCIRNVCLLLGTNTREVCKAALGFVTVLLTILDRATLAQHVKDVLGALFEWKSETRRHFRFRVKKMLERFVKKFGYDIIYSLVPPDHRKQLANLKKTRERQKRQQQERNQKNVNSTEQITLKSGKAESIEELLADSDSENDDATPKPAKKKSHGSAWLKDGQDEPINLLDQSTSQKIIASNPHAKGQRGRKDVFKSAADGRLIIGEEGEEKDEEDVENVFASIGIKKSNKESATTSPGQKRKLNEGVDFEDDETYKPGGKGIHRNVGDEYKAKKARGDVKKKGMPDPYAYIPLNKSTLNRRKRKKMQGQFEGLVRAAKHGAARGNKMKSNKRKSRN